VKFSLRFTQEAERNFSDIKSDKSKLGIEKQVNKVLGYLQVNPRHPSLHTHPFHSLDNPFNPKEKVFEAYVQNNTPAAYRVFWCYGPGKQEITIIAITPHP